jgi:hypothetical protein
MGNYVTNWAIIGFSGMNLLCGIVSFMQFVQRHSNYEAFSVLTKRLLKNKPFYRLNP